MVRGDAAVGNIGPRSHGATGKLFKLRIESYYATPEGGMGTAGGAYLIDVAAL